MEQKLKNLISSLAQSKIQGPLDIDITGIAYDSRKVEFGNLFVAIPGTVDDGRKFVADAVRKGASAVVTEGELFDNLEVTQIRVAKARQALANLSAEFFGHPTKNIFLIGVTGTNGKTTMTYLLEALWQAKGRSIGVVGTVNTRLGAHVLRAHQTTPESRDLQALFSQMRDQSMDAVIEVSSHALTQYRVEGCHFDAALFTNLTQDHLDYHQNMEEYYLAKEHLFVHHLNQSCKKKLAVLCLEDPFGKRLGYKLRGFPMDRRTYGFGADADVYPIKMKLNLDGICAELSVCGKKMEISSKLLGRFNLCNIMGAVTLADYRGFSADQIISGIQRTDYIPGRLERIPDSEGRLIFVDYAHTPDALKRALECLKDLAPRNIYTVFGCGGDRDKKKRSLMGFEAATHSTKCWVTSDNPRTEDPEKIIEDILLGVQKTKTPYIKISDRREAITQAIRAAQAGDVVLIAGKGHEDYQIMGKTKFPFRDQEVASHALDLRRN